MILLQLLLYVKYCVPCIPKITKFRCLVHSVALTYVMQHHKVTLPLAISEGLYRMGRLFSILTYVSCLVFFTHFFTEYGELFKLFEKELPENAKQVYIYIIA